ncbi:glycoside hydrolase family protein [Roseomonas marmotae]|uniref:Lysozyme n=1 Tax=Roseomonas marmotae TaxID=2768161 RepID=A0ABS3KBQ7_9PROT|nr:glycoside hydrolase family protein [Roseomonas marmotae]MBO1074877.1 glycoside hydrolase family protein [Roseomonas marmotae]QTI80620.1 glycoside hydrolase family protein [Roseomonas marmotae]
MSGAPSPLAALLAREEGLRLTVYDDATGKPLVPGMALRGHPTIGIGRCLDRKGITRAEALGLLENDLSEVRAQVAGALPWAGGLSEARQVVLQAMAFQLGLAGLLGFKGTLAAMRRGDWPAAAEGMLASLWARQTPARAARMAAMMRAG